MPTKKIADLPDYSGKPWANEERGPCRNQEHFPPAMRVLQPGIYEHTCPSCKHVTMFRVERVGLG